MPGRIQSRLHAPAYSRRRRTLHWHPALRLLLLMLLLLLLLLLLLAPHLCMRAGHRLVPHGARP